jgi:hypothetical protein
MLLGTASGTANGTLLPGGVLLPLDTDVLTTAMLTGFNTGPFIDTFGTLGARGEAVSRLVLPGGVIPAALVGLQLDFAHIVFDGSRPVMPLRVSNVVSVALVP